MAAATAKSAKGALSDNQLSPIVFFAGFVVFLVIALVAQMLTMNWRAWLPGAEGERSLIGGVRSAVYTFMSTIP